MQPSSPTAPAISATAWRTILCAALIVTVAMGVRQAFGLFLRPISMDLDVGRQAFSFAIAVNNLMFGLAQPFIGAWADRRGSGWVVAGGTALYVAGLVMTSLTASAMGLDLTLGVMVGLALSATTFVVVLGAVGRVVPEEKRSLAFGLVTAGGSLGQFLVVPLSQALLSSLDWREAMLALAALASTMILLAIGVSGRPTPRVGAAADGGTLGQAIRGAAGARSFWLLNAGFFVCGFHIAFVATHLPAYLRDSGLPDSVGAAALALIGLFNILGSWAWGLLGGRYPKKLLLVGLYAARAVSMVGFLLIPLSPASTLVFSATFGFLWLGTVPLTSGLVAHIWGMRYLSTLYGLVFLSHQVGSFLGAWLAGLAFDLTGSYQEVWIASVVLAVLAALVHLPVDERPAIAAPAT